MRRTDALTHSATVPALCPAKVSRNTNKFILVIASRLILCYIPKDKLSMWNKLRILEPGIAIHLKFADSTIIRV